MTTLTPTDQQLHACTASAGSAAVAPAPVGRRAAGLRPAALLVAGDVAALVAAIVAVGAPAWALVLVPAALAALSARGLHRARSAGVLETLARVVAAVTVAAGALVLVAGAVFPASAATAPLTRTWLLACVLLCAHRAAAMARGRDERGIPTVILGNGADAAELGRMLPAAGLRPIAAIDLDLADPRLDDPRVLADIALANGAHEVVVVPGGASDALVASLARACAEIGLGVSVRTAIGDAGGALVVEQAGPVPLLRLRAVDSADWRLIVKHGFDRVVAAFALLCIAPVFAGIALAIRLGSDGGVLFRQRRVGRDGREFDMLKFRSMRAATAPEDAAGSLGRDTAPGGVEAGTDRRTALGTLLRRTSLDELPQLLNVLRGDMSLVGPRPERPEFVDRFSIDIERYGERHRLKSGMTGLAQVNGLRGKTSIRDRVAYDNHYVEHFSLLLDAKILVQTVRAVFQDAE
ncbi:MAG: sugar transferase [Solirubrobacteraceae bacterium]